MMTEDSHSQYEEQIAKSEVPVKTFVVSVAEKISRDYEVIGAKSMAEAIRLVKENGGHFYHDEDRQSTEIDGTWDFHHEFTPKAVESLTSSPCVMIGKAFEKHREEVNRFTVTYYCDSIVKGGTGQLCRRCQQKLADGFTMRQPKEDE